MGFADDFESFRGAPGITNDFESFRSSPSAAPTPGETVDDKPWYNDAGEVARQTYWSTYHGIPLTLLKAARGIVTASGDDLSGDVTNKLSEYINFFDNRAVNEMVAPDLEGRGAAASTLIKGASNIGPSLAGMGAAAINPVLGGAAVFAAFGGSQYDDTYQRAIKSGLSEDKAHEAALMTGLIEGGGETIGDLVGAKAIKGTGGLLSELVGQGSARAAAKAATDSRLLVPFLRAQGENLAVQTATEYGQGAGEAAVEAGYGIRDEAGNLPDWAAQGAEGAQAAVGMSILLAPFGLPGAVRVRNQNRATANALADPNTDIEQRAEAVKRVYGAIREESPEAARAWASHAAQQLVSGQVIDIETGFDSVSGQADAILAAKTPDEAIAASEPTAAPAPVVADIAGANSVKEALDNLPTIEDIEGLLTTPIAPPIPPVQVGIGNVQTGRMDVTAGPAYDAAAVMPAPQQPVATQQHAEQPTVTAPEPAPRQAPPEAINRPMASNGEKEKRVLPLTLDGATRTANRLTNMGYPSRVIPHGEVAGRYRVVPIDSADIDRQSQVTSSTSTDLESIKQAASTAREVFRNADERAKLRQLGPDEYFAFTDKVIEAEKALVLKLAEYPDDGFGVQATTADGRMLTLTPSAQQPGKWQLTRFDANGTPWGDTNYDTKAQALKEFVQEADIKSIQSHGEIGSTQSPAPREQASAVPTDTTVDVGAHAAATSPTNQLPEPTKAQKEAGNYKKGHVSIDGMDISIENPQGSVRKGGRGKNAWKTTMQHHYGYIKGTVGRDKDHIDVFIKPGTTTSPQVFVVDQINPSTEKFDEHKVVLGAATEEEAAAIYRANYDKDWRGLGGINAMSADEFRKWLASGKTDQPISYREPVTVRTRRKTNSTRELLQAIISLGGLNVAMKNDVGGDSGARYRPGLFTRNGRMDLDALADDLISYGYEERIPTATDIGKSRELEDLIRRALNGERILASWAEQEEREKAERAPIWEEARAAGIRTAGRKFFDVLDDVLRLRQTMQQRAVEALDEQARKDYDTLVGEARALMVREVDDILESIPDSATPREAFDYLVANLLPLVESRIHEVNGELHIAAADQLREENERRYIEPAENDQATGEQPGEAGGAATGDRRDGETSFLTSYDRRDLEAKEQREQDEQVAAQAAAERERDVFALTPQAAPQRVTGRTQQGGMFTPDGRAAADATERQPDKPAAPQPTETASSEAVVTFDDRLRKATEGKTVTVNAKVVGSEIVTPLANQDAAEVVSQLRRDVAALDALRICMGA